MMKKLLMITLILMFLLPCRAFSVDLENVDLGGLVQVRGYHLENFLTFDDNNGVDDWSAFRLKASFWSNIHVGEGLSGYIKITNQTWGEGSTYQSTKNPVTYKWEKDTGSNKLFLDNAFINLNFAETKGLPLSIRLGRQNIKYGTGFVILDGNSQFGATSSYFDGLKISWQIKEKALLDAFYLKDQENDKANDIRYKDPDTGVTTVVGEDDINLLGVYLTAHCPVLGGQQEAYVLNKEDQAIEKDIFVYGIRISDSFGMGLDYSGEFAYQNGKWTDDIDHKARACNVELGYTFKQAGSKPRIFARYVFMSGDDSSNLSSENNNWDSVYGGWPQFGDLLAWKYVHVIGGQFSLYPPGSTPLTSTYQEATYHNLKMATMGASTHFWDVFLRCSYSNLKFDEAFITESNNFGDYFQMTFKYNYNKHLSFMLYGAYLDPDDGFQPEDNDSAQEVLFETTFEF